MNIQDIYNTQLVQIDKKYIHTFQSGRSTSFICCKARL